MWIRSGPARVLWSGQATTFGGAPLTLALAQPEAELSVELRFEGDGSGAPRVDSEAVPGGWRLTCAHFDDASGRGSALPVLLAEIGEDLVFLHFRVQRFGASVDRTVHFTFYRCGKAEVGWTPRQDGPGSTG